MNKYYVKLTSHIIFNLPTHARGSQRPIKKNFHNFLIYEINWHKCVTRKSSCLKPQTVYYPLHNLFKHNLFWGGGGGYPILSWPGWGTLSWSGQGSTPSYPRWREVPHPVLAGGTPCCPGQRYPILGYPCLGLGHLPSGTGYPHCLGLGYPPAGTGYPLGRDLVPVTGVSPL